MCGLVGKCLGLRRSQPDALRHACVRVPPDRKQALEMLQCPELGLEGPKICELVDKACGELAPENTRSVKKYLPSKTPKDIRLWIVKRSSSKASKGGIIGISISVLFHH